MGGKIDEAEVPAGLLEREGCVFCVCVCKGATAVRGLQEDLHT